MDDLAALLGFAPLPDWMRDALCPEYPDVAFFTNRGESTEPAKAVCARCLVLRECRDYAVAEDIRDGIWGGTTARERTALRASQGSATRAA
jgi:WhiB family transcriptional regulator, redox-sensing transcriptional regulator